MKCFENLLRIVANYGIWLLESRYKTEIFCKLSCWISCGFCRTHEYIEDWLWALANWFGFLDTFAKLRKTTISFVMSACPSVCMEKHGFHWTDFLDIWHLNIYRKSVAKIQVSLKSDMNDVYLRLRPIYIFITSHSVLLGMRDVSGNHLRENQNTFDFQ